MSEQQTQSTVPAWLVHRLDSIFCNTPGVDTVELGALLIDMTGCANDPDRDNKETTPQK